MSRVHVHAPSLRRRPVRARRAVGQHVPVEYSAEPTAPRWLIVGTGVLGLLALVLLIVGMAVIS